MMRRYSQHKGRAWAGQGKPERAQLAAVTVILLEVILMLMVVAIRQ